jgi:hypothetical protein
MMTRPARAGMATHSAVSISGAARCSVFCQENQSPKAPLNSSTQTSTGLDPRKPDEHAEQQQRQRDGGDGQGDVGEGAHGSFRLSSRA